MKLSTVFNIAFAAITAIESAFMVGAAVHYLESKQIAWLYCTLLLLGFSIVSLAVFLFHEQLICWICITFYDDDLEDFNDGNIIDYEP